MAHTDDGRLLDYLSNQLSPADESQVERSLKAEPDLAARLIELARDEAGIIEWARGRERSTVLPNRPRTRTRWLVLFAAAASILIALATNWWIHRPERGPWPGPSEPFARLAEVRGEAFIDTPTGPMAIVPGQKLRLGDSVRTGPEGTAVVWMPDGDRIELSQDTSIRIDPDAGDWRMFLERGSIRADTRGGVGTPMVVSTSHASVRMDGMVIISDSDDTVVKTEIGNAYVTRTSDGVQFHIPEGQFAPTATSDHRAPTIRPMPKAATEPKAAFRYPAGAVLQAGVSPTGILAVLTADSLTLRSWANGGKLAELREAAGRIGSFTWSADGAVLATASNDRTVRIRNGLTGLELAQIPKQAGELKSIGLSADGQWLAVGTGTGERFARLTIYAAATGSEVAVLAEPNDPVTTVAFAASGDRFAAATRDGTVRVWEIGTWQPVGEPLVHPKKVLCLAFSPDGRSLAVGTRGAILRVYDLTRPGRSTDFDPAGETVRAVAFSPDGTRLAAGTGRSAWLWDVSTGKAIASLFADKSRETAIAFDRAGTALVTSISDRSVRVWTFE